MRTPMGIELPAQLRDAVGRELGEKERILWLGRPDANRMMRQSGCILFFAIPWTAFSIFWTVMAFAGISKMGTINPLSLLFPAFGLPFVAIGVAMFLTPYWTKKQALNTAYAITNKRILIVKHQGKTTNTQMFQPALEDLEKNEKADGSGDLVFQKKIGRDSDGDKTIEKVQFVGIPDVRRVEALLMETFFDTPTDDSPAETDVMPSEIWEETRWSTDPNR